MLSDNAFSEILPPFLHDVSKGRIKEALSQFAREVGPIDYSSFYLQFPPEYLMQGDILHSVQSIMWDNSDQAQVGFSPVMIISNSCDVSPENNRTTNQKDILLAPIIPLDEIIVDLSDNGFDSSQIENYRAVLKRQEFTNLFYLPPNNFNNKEYVVRFDRIYWVPISFIKHAINDPKKQRFISLSQWGWYLFIVKLSIHTCRTPETIERPDIEN